MSNDHGTGRARAAPRYEHDPNTGLLADGAAGLATALYIVAREQGIQPADVHRPAVEELIERKDAEYDSGIPLRWEARLQYLGHDLDSTDDAVAVRWRILRTLHNPPEYDCEDSMARCGPGVLEGLRYVLSPSMDLQF